LPINNTIAKDSLPATKDFNYLREKGLTYIQQLSGKLWTDHNLHDPGITILEVLCYALMDLGYRTGFSMNDMVREEDGTVTSNAFHPAKRIFTSEPITVNDYRRLLVDIPGIRNAWLFPEDENKKTWGEGIRLFAYCKESVLLHESEIDTAIPIPEDRQHVRKNEEVNIKGLYAVKIELDEHPLFGDLNSSVVPIKFIKDDLASSEAEIIFPHWSSVDKNGNELITMFNADKISEVTVELVVPVTTTVKIFEKLKRSKWETRWTIKYGTEERVLENVIVKMTKLPDLFKGVVVGKSLIDSINGSLAKEGMKRYCQRPREIFKIFSRVRTKLMQHRNLCEDFLNNISTVDTEDMSICSDIDVDVNADIESIQAQIFSAVENYLLPPVQFSTLKELLDKNVPVEEIFNGPLLEHGFLTNEAMQEADLKQQYYTSDIISLLMDIPGIKNIRNFQFSISKNGVVKPDNDSWKIKVTPNHKLKLDREKCKLLYFKNELPLNARFQESINKLRLQQALQTHLKYKDPSNAIELPNGKYRSLEKHYTILNEFPMVYGLGEKDLPENASPERKARVKQLEAYLTFFDHLIADYFSQLLHVKDMLSWKSDLNQTYFTQYFHQDKDAVQLYWDYVEEKEGDKKIWKNTFLNKVFDDKDIASRSPVELAYMKGKKGLQYLKESTSTYLDRKNRLLDHLISRFAESFNDYAMYMYALPDEKIINDEEVSHELIIDKLNFLQNYPELSSQRTKAYDYSLSEDEILGTKGISGFARRMMALLGMEFTQNKKLSDIDENGNGGFHLLEHILLRPVKDKDQLLSVCLDPGCDHCGEEDPYSFKISIIIPFWVKRFKNMHFRSYVETLFRSEAPAHVFLKICWIDKDEMKKIETALGDWMKAKADYTEALPSPGDTKQKKYSAALEKLIITMQDLRTDFPEATLHDCTDKDEANDNRVFLGHTALGTFNPNQDE